MDPNAALSTLREITTGICEISARPAPADTAPAH
ncbi:hypothetical protein P3T29_006434 [Kitasatospora sp. MAP5-34]|nr:hypothetical protein [Kitasatospora sp. MAP5-34]